MYGPKEQLDHVIHDQLVSKLPRYYTSRILKEDMRRQNIRMYERGVIGDFVGKELYDKIMEWQEKLKSKGGDQDKEDG